MKEKHLKTRKHKDNLEILKRLMKQQDVVINNENDSFDLENNDNETNFKENQGGVQTNEQSKDLINDKSVNSENIINTNKIKNKNKNHKINQDKNKHEFIDNENINQEENYSKDKIDLIENPKKKNKNKNKKNDHEKDHEKDHYDIKLDADDPASKFIKKSNFLEELDQINDEDD